MRGAAGVIDSITSELYVRSAGCLPMVHLCCTVASQAGSRPVATTGKRGACPSWRYDCPSQQKTCQNAFAVRYRGILRLGDCFQLDRSISSGYRCAYARHTPRAYARHIHIPFGVVCLAAGAAPGLHHTHS
jgi:hypothetical protein